ncbi:MAG: molybdenum cofactor guanylyltransferase MobA [bacterium]
MNANSHEFSMVCGVVLAGGRGSRMDGRDKGLVCYQDKPLIERVLARLPYSLGAVCISANRNLAQYRRYSECVVVDKQSTFEGPLAGIMAAMENKPEFEWFFVVPCDVPYLPENLLPRLWSARSQKKPVAASDGERLQGLCVLIHQDDLPGLKAYLNAGERRVMRWLNENQCIAVDFSDQKAAFKNINQLEV